MIIEEANKVVEWQRTAELARREAIHHAADVHGHGGASAAEGARERSELVQAMLAQKGTIMLLSTVRVCVVCLCVVCVLLIKPFSRLHVDIQHTQRPC